MMTVTELIVLLQSLPQDAKILVDSEYGYMVGYNGFKANPDHWAKEDNEIVLENILMNDQIKEENN